jgi:hypothetical protein
MKIDTYWSSTDEGAINRKDVERLQQTFDNGGDVAVIDFLSDILYFITTMHTNAINRDKLDKGLY